MDHASILALVIVKLSKCSLDFPSLKYLFGHCLYSWIRGWMLIDTWMFRTPFGYVITNYVSYAFDM